jgi:hypothetical protein
MITQVKEGYNYINVSIACLSKSNGAAIDPTSAEAWFCRLNQATGAIALDTNIDTDGKVPLTKQISEIGFYGAGIPISTLTAGEYTVLYKITINSVDTIAVENFSIDDSKNVIDTIDGKVDTIYVDIGIIDGKVDTINTTTEQTNQIQKGGRKMVSNQEIFYKTDNITEIFRVTYYNNEGEPTIDDPFERRTS